MLSSITIKATATVQWSNPFVPDSQRAFAGAWMVSPGDEYLQVGAMNIGAGIEVLIEGDAARPALAKTVESGKEVRTATWTIERDEWSLLVVARKVAGVKWGTLKISGHDGNGDPFEYEGAAIVRIPAFA